MVTGLWEIHENEASLMVQRLAHRHDKAKWDMVLQHLKLDSKKPDRLSFDERSPSVALFVSKKQ